MSLSCGRVVQFFIVGPLHRKRSEGAADEERTTIEAQRERSELRNTPTKTLQPQCQPQAGARLPQPKRKPSTKTKNQNENENDAPRTRTTHRERERERTALLRRDDPAPNRVPHQGHHRVQPKLRHQVHPVRLHRLEPDAKRRRDLLVGLSLREKLEHLALPRRERPSGRVLAVW